MRRGRAEVGRPLRPRHLRREPFELAAADVFEVLPRGLAGGFLVEIDRHARSARRPSAPTSLRQRHAVGHRHALDRDERHDVDRAEPRMLALVVRGGR